MGVHSGPLVGAGCVCVLSHVQLFATPWTAACQAPLSVGSSRQECWSGLPLSAPGNLPNPGIKPASLVSPALAGRFFTTVPRGKQDRGPLSTSRLGKVGGPSQAFTGTSTETYEDMSVGHQGVPAGDCPSWPR